jgi:Peptidase family M28
MTKTYIVTGFSALLAANAQGQGVAYHAQRSEVAIDQNERTAAANTPNPVKLRATVEKLVSFGTRHTASSATDPKRGIGAARTWVANEFAKLGLAVDRPFRRFDGPRAPQGVIVEDVLGIQRGTGDPNHVVIVAGHIDSRVSDVMDATRDAPGANDDGSGVALVLEAARILSKERFGATIVYAVLSGEEQGLWGGTLLAETAKARGWHVAAMLNNDIVGNTVGQDGRRVTDRVRVFSEGIGAAEDLPALKGRRASGSEDDSSSRALAKRIGQIASWCVAPIASGVAVITRLCWRLALARPCAFRWESRTTMLSIRTSAPKTAVCMATRPTGWTFPTSPRLQRSILQRCVSLPPPRLHRQPHRLGVPFRPTRS